jgi:hypothetical protein
VVNIFYKKKLGFSRNPWDVASKQTSMFELGDVPLERVVDAETLRDEGEDIQ